VAAWLTGMRSARTGAEATTERPVAVAGLEQQRNGDEQLAYDQADITGGPLDRLAGPVSRAGDTILTSTTSLAAGIRRSRAAASPPGELLPATAQPRLHAKAVLAATAAAAAAPSVRVREERSAVPPGAAAGRAAAERVQP